MKKVLSVFIVLMMIMGFASCAKPSAEPEENVAKSTKVTTTRLATQDAVIKEDKAINLIKSYSSEELGLTEQDMKDCSFMVAKYGERIGGENYVKVVAAIRTENKDESGEVFYSLENKGEYYISYDGTKILSKNLKDNTYTKLSIK